MNVRTLSACFCLLFCTANLQAAITLTPVQTVVLNGTATAATVTIDLIVNNTVAGQQVGFYAFSVNLAGPSISGVTASYDNLSVWGGVNGLFHAPNPSIVGNVITFRAGGPDPLNLPIPDPFNIVAPVGNSRIGTVTFTTTLNGAFTATTTQQSTQGVFPGGTQAALFGFVQDVNAGPGGELQLTAAGDFKQGNFSVAGITAVPEPTSLLLIGVAVAGLAGQRLRRAKRTA